MYACMLCVQINRYLVYRDIEIVLSSSHVAHLLSTVNSATGSRYKSDISVIVCRLLPLCMIVRFPSISQTLFKLLRPPCQILTLSSKPYRP